MELDEELVQKLVRLSEGFAGSDLEAAVREVVKQSIVKGKNTITNETFISYFQNIVPLSQTSPEQIADIRLWGKERAVPAGKPLDRGEPNSVKNTGRAVIV